MKKYLILVFLVFLSSQVWAQDSSFDDTSVVNNDGQSSDGQSSVTSDSSSPQPDATAPDSSSDSGTPGMCEPQIATDDSYADASTVATDSAVATTPAEFLVIGHMGAPMQAPDSTIESFQTALDIGANAIETDLCFTKDEQIVFWHDWDPDSLIAHFREDGKLGLKCKPIFPDSGDAFRRPVCELTLDEFREHYGFRLREASGQDAPPPERVTYLGPTTSDEPVQPNYLKNKLPNQILTIEDFCAWAAGQDKLKRVFFDCKLTMKNKDMADHYFAKMVSVVSQYGLNNKVIIMETENDLIDVAKTYAVPAGIDVCHDQELAPGIIVHPSKFYTVPDAIKHDVAWAAVGKPVITLFGSSIYKSILESDLSLIDQMKDKNLAVPLKGLIAWTIEDPAEMQTIIKMGVRGIMTNHPDVLRQVVDSNQ
ncbi:MAG: hypothetical protein HQM09_04385 [Candidatus Riflebacteria bacterium]|nr:hypothetical protein [Candidatus Riflebacteria bacterium]